MLDLSIQIISIISFVGGVFFILTGSIGLIRLPDVFSRIHAAGMIDTAGASFIILGMILQSGFSLITAKLVFIGIFISNIVTAKVILSKTEDPELFSVKASQKTNEGKVTYANSITLTPGTVTTQIKNDTFEVHALTKEFGDDVRSSVMDKMVTWLEKGK